MRRYIDVALALTALQRRGLVREVGLTNFGLATTRELVAAGVPVAATQVQLSLLDRRAEASGLSAYCEAHGIALLPYGVLAGGLLSERYLGMPPPSADPTTHETRSLTKYLLIVEEAGGWACLQALLRRLHILAEGAGLTIAELAVAWALSRAGVRAVIVGARGQARIGATCALASTRVSAKLLAECTAAAEATLRPVPGEVYELERDRDGRHGRIMRYNLQQMSGAAYVEELEERERAADEAWRVQTAAATGEVSRRVAARRFRQQAAALVGEASAVAGRTEEAADVRRRAQQVVRRLHPATKL